MRGAGATRSSDALCTLCPAGTFSNATGENSYAKDDVEDGRGGVKRVDALAAGHDGDGRDCVGEEAPRSQMSCMGSIQLC